ncbi:MAG TPA: hypothetical protein VLS48_01410 [Anaerolineales bacterium]|nr:hypothetical protein [Anaerolineales bacterium]
MIGRIGQFIFFVGLIAMIIFFASDRAQAPAYEFFCGGLVIFLFGVLLMWRTRPPAKDSGRFRMLRRRKDNSKS